MGRPQPSTPRPDLRALGERPLAGVESFVYHRILRQYLQLRVEGFEEPVELEQLQVAYARNCRMALLQQGALCILVGKETDCRQWQQAREPQGEQEGTSESRTKLHLP
jgi:hypothetical protein